MTTQANSSAPGGWYRAREGWMLGVCKGAARAAELPVAVVRLTALVLMLVTGIWPAVLIYFIAAILMKPEPALAPENDADWEFYHSVATDRRRALARLKRKFDDVDRRTRRLEDIVTSRGYKWDQRLRDGR